MSIGVAVRAESEFHVTGRNPVNAVISIRALSRPFLAEGIDTIRNACKDVRTLMQATY